MIRGLTLQPVEELISGNDVSTFTPLVRSAPMVAYSECMKRIHLLRAINGDYRGMVANGIMTEESAYRHCRYGRLLAHTTLYDYLKTGDSDFLNLPSYYQHITIPKAISYLLDPGYVSHHRMNGINRYLFIGDCPIHEHFVNEKGDVVMTRDYLGKKIETTADGK